MAKQEKKRKGRTRGNGRGSVFKRTPVKPGAPWIMQWYDAEGKRRERSSRTSDKRTAERILADILDKVAERRARLVDVRAERIVEQGRKPLAQHIKDYVAHCHHAGHNARHVVQKERHLTWMTEAAGITRLSELTADALEGYLRGIRERGLSARTANFARQLAVAFMSWCAKTGRADVNGLVVVPKLDESTDRRRVRRPLTDEELSRLLAVAEDRGRKAWYLAAALAGLRLGDLRRLTWGDVDFDAGAITVHDGKAKREDIIPMHPQFGRGAHASSAGLPGLADHPRLPPGGHGPDSAKGLPAGGLGSQGSGQGRQRRAHHDRQGEATASQNTHRDDGRRGPSGGPARSSDDAGHKPRPAGGCPPDRPADHAARRLPNHVEALHGTRSDRHGSSHRAGPDDQQGQCEIPAMYA